MVRQEQGTAKVLPRFLALVPGWTVMTLIDQKEPGEGSEPKIKERLASHGKRVWTGVRNGTEGPGQTLTPESLAVN